MFLLGYGTNLILVHKNGMVILDYNLVTVSDILNKDGDLLPSCTATAFEFFPFIHNFMQFATYYPIVQYEVEFCIQLRYSGLYLPLSSRCAYHYQYSVLTTFHWCDLPELFIEEVRILRLFII